MAVDTAEKLKDYILRQLGSPYITVEISDDSLDDIIEETIQEFSAFAYDGETVETFLIESTGKGIYKVPLNTSSIKKLSKGSGLSPYAGVGGGLVLSYDQLSNWGWSAGDMISRINNISTQMSILSHYFGDEVAYSFNANKKEITIFEPFHGPMIAMLNMSYVPDSIDLIFNHIWIKKMCVAKARIIQSVVLGKHDQTLVGGARINYADIRTQGQEELLALKDELIQKYAGPCPIFVG